MQQPSIIHQRYRVISFLGSGGFGETYLVEDLEMPSKRQCVLKCLKPIVNDAATYELIQQRFLREATILEMLGSQHPQIPSLYAYFQKEGRFYLVQEWIDGSTLQKIVQTQGVMRPDPVRTMLDSLLGILAYVHSQRIIHRDIKPDNIILRARDQEPVLLDFGAVKEAMGTVIHGTQGSQNTLVVGTPGFMPSEQSAGRPVYSSDLYAAGLTALYALTQKLPEQFASDPATGKLLWHREVPALDANLAAVIDQAIEPYPPHRFASAQQMRAALGGQTVTAPPMVSGPPPAIATVVAAPGNITTEAYAPPPDAPYTQSSPSQSAWPKALLVGTAIGGFGLLALIVPRLLMSNNNSIDPTEEPPQTTVVVPDAPEAEAGDREVAPPDQSSSSSAGSSIADPVAPPSSVPQPRPDLAEDTSADALPEESPLETRDLDANTSAAVVANLYGAIAAEQWDTAAAYFTPDASPPFDPGFFQQFAQVTVTNLRVTDQTDSTLTLVGENTYVWPDGSSQREERSFTIRDEGGQALISDSAFIRMIQERN